MRTFVIALLIILGLATEPSPFEGGVGQTVVWRERNVTVFAAGFYERPGGPPETEGPKWIPGGTWDLCSVSTFSELSSNERAEEGMELERWRIEGAEEGERSQGKDDENSRGEGEPGESERLANMNDCLPLHHWASSHAGHWVIPQRNLPSSILLTVESCVVTVGVPREWRSKLPWGVAVSTEDVKRVVGEVLEKYRVEGRVGGLGAMGCLGWGRWEPIAVPVDWRVGGWEVEG